MRRCCARSEHQNSSYSGAPECSAGSGSGSGCTCTAKSLRGQPHGQQSRAPREAPRRKGRDAEPAHLGARRLCGRRCSARLRLRLRRRLAGRRRGLDCRRRGRIGERRLQPPGELGGSLLRPALVLIALLAREVRAPVVLVLLLPRCADRRGSAAAVDESPSFGGRVAEQAEQAGAHPACPCACSRPPACACRKGSSRTRSAPPGPAGPPSRACPRAATMRELRQPSTLTSLFLSSSPPSTLLFPCAAAPRSASPQVAAGFKVASCCRLAVWYGLHSHTTVSIIGSEVSRPLSTVAKPADGPRFLRQKK